MNDHVFYCQCSVRWIWSMVLVRDSLPFWKLRWDLNDFFFLQESTDLVYLGVPCMCNCWLLSLAYYRIVTYTLTKCHGVPCSLPSRITIKVLKNCKTFSSRPRPRPGEDLMFKTQDQRHDVLLNRWSKIVTWLILTNHSPISRSAQPITPTCLYACSSYSGWTRRTHESSIYHCQYIFIHADDVRLHRFASRDSAQSL